MPQLLSPDTGLSSDRQLIVLQHLVREINRLGGQAGHLNPAGHGPALRLSEPDPGKYLVAALLNLAGTPDIHPTELTQRALRQIARSWGKKRRVFEDLTPAIPEADRFSTYHRSAAAGLRRLADFSERDLAISLNSSHPKATRLYAAVAELGPDGCLQVSLTFGYPRDASSWSLRRGDARLCRRGVLTDLVDVFTQQPGEDGPSALRRITDEIEKILVQVPPSRVFGYQCPPLHKQAILREEFYHSLRRDLDECARGGGDFTRGAELKADEETKERFGHAEEAPYTLADEIASMLADLLVRERVTESEMTILARGFKNMRRFTPVNTLAEIFRASLANRNYGDLRDQPAPEPGPNYHALTSCLRKARQVKARVLAWIPSSAVGLIRVRWGQIRLNRKKNTITYRGRTMDVGVIRQIDCLPGRS